ncbi:host attachment protein [Thiohalophilus sp.]|uniref:host attachment protein n=1 Tax=Thiohalophilus sp. TaxID=3028392 RepID=UPI002ACEC226|nr:host attachment protein [Thiohalophilus sp.]MDZ7663025.1 host attachment protein [Thiohalophilus sp.]
MPKTWILVADSSRARLFSADTASSPLIEVETFTHPASRQHEQDITSDLPGKQNGKGINGSFAHAMTQETDPKKHEAINFSREIAQHINKAHGKNKFKQLIIVAAPNFLGLLRDSLNESTRRSLTLQLDKNLTRQNPDAIRKHLPEYLPNLELH